MALPDALFRAAFEQSSTAQVVLDGSGLLALWNSAFERLFQGIAEVGPDRLRSSFFDFLADREGGHLDYYAAELLLGGRSSARMESPLRTADGQKRWFRIELSLLEPSALLPGERGSRLLLCSLEDVTDRVSREKRLLEAKEEAEKATHTKSLFLANMSHEIRTPIQTILGTVELLQETALDGEQAEYAAQVRFSAEVLLGLINDILDFSKIEAGKLDLEASDFDLRACIFQSVDLLVLDAHRKGLEVTVDLDDSLPTLVRGDSARLRQIIVNLFKNAVKFTAEGEIGVQIRRIAGSPEPRARFEVSDTGIGIPEEVRGRLFTPFYQADFAAARKAGGTGLGLAISRRLVELMGGTIGVSPNAPRGSVFWFELPLRIPAYSSPPIRVHGAPGGARLLVVDDNARARSLAADTAAKAGYRVAEADSGEAALGLLRAAAARGEPFSLCLVDQNMPKMDGWRLASEITSDTSINGARLVLMVPEGTMGGEAKMKLLRWFNAYVSKPLRPGLVLEALARAAASDVDLPSAEASTEPAGAEAESIPELEGLFEAEVLVAEDHEVNRELFTVILSRLGCEVVAARDGAEAAEIGAGRLAEHRPFDIVLMDIFMPRMNGYEATARLREAGYQGPIVAVTASALKGEREKCIAAGMNDILVKPFKKKDLSAILAAWLPPERGGSRSGAKPALEKFEPGTVEMAEAAGSDQPQESTDGPEDPGVFDWEGVLDTFLGQRETVLRLLERFVDKARGQVEELAGALEASDWSRFREVAHSLKGASWNLAAKGLGDAAFVAENAGRAGDAAAAQEALGAIRPAFRSFEKAALKRLATG